jgi:hypothetical protein
MLAFSIEVANSDVASSIDLNSSTGVFIWSLIAVRVPHTGWSAQALYSLGIIHEFVGIAKNSIERERDEHDTQNPKLRVQRLAPKVSGSKSISSDNTTLFLHLLITPATYVKAFCLEACFFSVILNKKDFFTHVKRGNHL